MAAAASFITSVDDRSYNIVGQSSALAVMFVVGKSVGVSGSCGAAVRNDAQTAEMTGAVRSRTAERSNVIRIHSRPNCARAAIMCDHAAMAGRRSCYAAEELCSGRNDAQTEQRDRLYGSVSHTCGVILCDYADDYDSHHC